MIIIEIINQIHLQNKVFIFSDGQNFFCSAVFNKE